MSQDMLGAQDNLGIVVDFVTKLKNGAISPAEAKRFLRRENPFDTKDVGAFNPVTFIGKGWKIIEDQELLPENWDPSKTVIESALKSGENYVTGEETRRRFAKKPLLGAKAFWHFWNNQVDIPGEWKGKYVFFDAAVLQSPHGDRASLYLCWDGSQWDWGYDWRGSGRLADDVSACAS